MGEGKRLTDKAKLDDTGRILIPVEMRKAMGLKPGEYVALVLEEDALRVMNTEQTVRSVQRMLGFPIQRSLVDELIQERREEASRE